MEDYKLQVSLKDNLGDMLNVRANSTAELGQYLDEFTAQLIGKIKATQQLLRAAEVAAGMLGVAPAVQQPVAPVPDVATGAFQQYAQPAPPPAPPAPAAQAGAPVCNHGTPARWVPPGVSKRTNNPYPGFWSCSMPKEQQCDFKAN